MQEVYRRDDLRADAAKQEGLPNRERCEVVDNGLLGDMPNAEGCVDLAVTTRTRSGWKRLSEPMIL